MKLRVPSEEVAAKQLYEMVLKLKKEALERELKAGSDAVFFMDSMEVSISAMEGKTPMEYVMWLLATEDFLEPSWSELDCRAHGKWERFCKLLRFAQMDGIEVIPAHNEEKLVFIFRKDGMLPYYSEFVDVEIVYTENAEDECLEWDNCRCYFHTPASKDWKEVLGLEYSMYD